VANRGEIARRVMRTCRRLDIHTIAIFSDADAGAAHVAEADEAVRVGGAPPADSYLNIRAVISAALESGAEAVHPGYGFLAENSDFARAVTDAGLTWIGPDPETIDLMGDKINARNFMHGVGVPVAPGTPSPLRDADAVARAAGDLGFPLMVKASGGGGGIGMGIANDDEELARVFATTQSRAERFFGSGDILLERLIRPARHVEVQILGRVDGTVVALGDRDCSVQRRHQKVLEESPSPGITDRLRERMFAAAVAAGEAVRYKGAGTIECLVDPEAQEFYFLEMNTRLQVEHPVTEMTTHVDLVEEQLRVASGEEASVSATPAPDGHAIEARVYAEDPQRFLPSPGEISVWEEPNGSGIRIDAAYRAGDTVTPFYDPLLAKVCVSAADRNAALDRLHSTLEDFKIVGPKTNIPFLIEALATPQFAQGRYDTGLVDLLR